MTSHPFRIISVLLAVGGLAACSSDSDDSADDTSDASESASASSTETDASATTAVGAATTLPVTVATEVVTTTAAAGTTAAPPTTAPATSYSVVAGDSLSLISDRTCMTLAELAAANDWADGADHVIHPGDVVQITPGACEGAETIPVNYTLPYTAPPTRTPSEATCDAVLAAYDTLFAGPPLESTEDEARAWASTAVAALRAAAEAIQPPIDVDAELDALEADEPDVAAGYVTFLRDTTNGDAFAAMQDASDTTGLTRYALSVAISGACPSQ